MNVESYKAIAEILALLAAAVFFGYKVWVGYFYPDLSLNLSSQRTHVVGGTATLVITVRLKKGSHGSICLHDLGAKVAFQDKTLTTKFVGFHRMSFFTVPFGAEDDRKLIDWSGISASAPLVRLPPSEETEFSCFVNIPKDSVCVVEVAAIGKGQHWGAKVGQWRASHVSIPQTA